MTKAFRVGKQLQQILAEIKFIDDSGVTNTEYRKLLVEEAQDLQKKFRHYHGFNYHPLLASYYADKRRDVE